ncbi:hypothetical protein [Amycolatopsis cihanbeyliensis]|nr:hypothetical protein [Amycolatopsis cihanbeyliensis]
MAEAITATYVQEDEDWSITVSGLGKELAARAPGIIAARDRADQLVEELGPDSKGTTVVHLLEGSALEFTTTYMTARLARTPTEQEVAEAEQQVDTDTETTGTTEDTGDAADIEVVEDTEDVEDVEDTASATAEADSQDDAEVRPELPQQISTEGKQAAGAKPTVPTKELSTDPRWDAEKDAQPAGH